MTDDVLFHPDGDLLVPTELARGPWSDSALHGGPVAAAVGRAVERVEVDPERPMHVTRVAVELLGPVPLAPMAVRARVARAGKRIQLVEVEVASEGAVIARANAWRIAPVPALGDAIVVLDDRLPVPDPAALETFDSLGYRSFGHAVEICSVGHTFREPGAATVWVRLLVPVVAGEDTSPLCRALAASDFGNGISGMLAFDEFLFVNTDLTVTLQRPPTGEWVALDATTWIEPDAGAYCESALYDERGRIGRALQSLYVGRAMSEPVVIAAVPAGSPEAVELVRVYLDEIAARGAVDPNGVNTAPDPPEQYEPPVGVFLVVRVDGVARGCGALRMCAPGVGEVKRMWLHADVRGRGLARRLLDELEAHARQLGCTAVRLDTNGVLSQAIALYTSAGYEPIARYNDNPDATHFFEKRIANPPGGVDRP